MTDVPPLEYDLSIYGEEPANTGNKPVLPSNEIIRSTLIDLCKQRGITPRDIPALVLRVREVVRQFIEERGDTIIDIFTLSEALTVAAPPISTDADPLLMHFKPRFPQEKTK